MKIKRYRLRKKYRILLKKYAKLFFVVLLLLGVFHLGKVMYRNFFDKDENTNDLMALCGLLAHHTCIV